MFAITKIENLGMLTKAYSESKQPSKVELFAKLVVSFYSPLKHQKWNIVFRGYRERPRFSKKIHLRCLSGNKPLHNEN